MATATEKKKPATRRRRKAETNGATPEESTNGAAPGGMTGITIPRIDVKELLITLIGDAPVICNKWSEKAKAMMLAKQKKEAKAAREAKDPEGEFHSSLYVDPDGDYAAPAVWFKASAVAACRYIDGMKMTEARGAFHVIGDLVKLHAPPPTMREDMVRIGSGTADIRYRGQFDPWGVNLRISFNAGALSAAQIINLFNVAGFGVGVGEWRPSRDGSYGRFHVAVDGEKVPHDPTQVIVYVPTASDAEKEASA